MCSTWGALKGYERYFPSGHMKIWKIAKHTPCSQRIALGSPHKLPFTKVRLAIDRGEYGEGVAQYEVHWRACLGAMDPPNGHATPHMAHTTYCPKRQLSPRYVMPLQGHNFVSIAHRNSRRVPMQHQHLRATLESYLNARNVMAKEL